MEQKTSILSADLGIPIENLDNQVFGGEQY